MSSGTNVWGDNCLGGQMSGKTNVLGNTCPGGRWVVGGVDSVIILQISSPVEHDWNMPTGTVLSNIWVVTSS